MKRLLFSLLFIFAFTLSFMKVQGQTTLSPGDLIIVAINGDRDDAQGYPRGFSCVTLVNLEANTVIYFTEYGWSDNTNYFITNTSVSDHFVKYTVPSGGQTAGTIIRCDENHTGNFTALFNYAGATPLNYLSPAGLTNGDEILAFQASYNSDTQLFSSIQFICAASIVSTALVSSGWATNVSTNGTDGSGAGSALPPGLTDDINAFSFNQPSTANDNCAYNSPITAATKEDWQIRIKNYSNWIFNDAVPIPTPQVGPFVVLGFTPTITSATYNSLTGALVVTGANLTAKSSGLDIDATKFTITGQAGGTRTLTAATSNVEITSPTEFTLTIAGADKTAVDNLLNKNGTSSVGGTTYNLAATDDWCTNVVGGADLTGNGIIVGNVGLSLAWVNVGNAGNLADATTFGAVATEYSIMQYEFTNSQYANYLNAIDPDGTNPNSVYNANMGSHAYGGISFSAGASPGSKYAVKTNMGDKPVNYNCWWDVVRVCNWLHNGAPIYSSSNSLGTAPHNQGAYNIGTSISGDAIAKESGALYWIPTENEWYKAAYYNGNTSSYTTYGNGFSAAPTQVSANSSGVGSAGNSGNFANFNSGAAWNTPTLYFTTVGTNGSANFYGAYDMSGNAWELNDRDGLPGAHRGFRGGDFGGNSIAISKSTSFADQGTVRDFSGDGFRLASNPVQPSIGSATYNASTGDLVVSGIGFTSKSGASDIDATKFTITGQGGATRTLSTTSDVEITSGSSFTLTIAGADKTAVDNILNKNGTSSVDGITYNLAATDDWCTNVVGGADLTGNGITVSGVLPYIYVDASKADNSGSGRSWATAKKDLQEALDLAISGDQIWVKAGTYKPTSAYDLTNTSRYYHFRMIEGVEIYGGFAGTEASDYDLGLRNFVTNETILSGDIGTADVNTDNCYHVFYHPDGLGLSSSAILDGFTITGGNADGSDPHNYGAGAYNNNNHSTFKNCKFFNNATNYRGGAITFINSISSVDNSIFFDNSAGNSGGGVFLDNSNVSFTNTTFTQNFAWNGGGMWIANSTNVLFNNSILWGNTKGGGGVGTQIGLFQSTITLNFSCYSIVASAIFNNASTFTTTNNNITSDPKFVDAANDDFRIYGNSPCVDTGNDAYNSETTDIRGAGFSRKLDKTNGGVGTIDMGAYEYKFGTDPATDAPNNPTSFSAVVNSSSQIDLSWAFNGNSDPVVVAYNTTSTFGNPSGTYSAGNTIGGGGTVLYTGTNTSFNHTSLTPGTLYYYKIWSKDGSDVYSSGDTEDEWTLPATPDAPTVTNTAASNTLNVAVNVGTNGSGAEYAIRLGVLFVQDDGTLGGTEDWATAATWGTKTVSGLSVNTEYTFDVKARNGNSIPDVSGYSTSASLFTRANTPDAMTFAGNTQTSIDLQIVPNDNPAGTEYAIYNGSQYLQTDGSTFTGTEAWQTEVQWEATSSNLRISGLSSGTTYSWQAKARNADNTETALSTALETKTLPSEASSVSFSNIAATTFTINWTRGNGDGVKVFLKQTDEGSAMPSVATNYLGDAAFGSGGEITGSGWYCVYSGTGTSVDVTNVNNTNNLYKVHVLEYVSFTGLNYIYNTESTTSTAVSISTPSSQATNITFSNITRTSMTVRWTRGNGDGSVLLGKEKYRIPVSPLTDGNTYENANSVYTSAPAVNGTKVLYWGTDEIPSVNVTALTRYQLVYFKVCEYNNPTAPYYLQTENASNPRSRWTLRRDGFMEEDLTLDAEFAYPNPATNSISTTLDVYEEGTVSVALYDIEGKKVIELYNQTLPFGSHDLTFDISRVSSGVYQLIMTKGSEAIAYPVAVVK